MIVKCPENVFLKKYLTDNGYSLRTSCGGRGNCGKCVVKIIEGEAAVNTMDRMWFSDQQLKEGYRLGCQVHAKTPVVVEIPDPA